MTNVPPFTIGAFLPLALSLLTRSYHTDTPRYDQSTYYGRWRQFAELVSPKWLFVTEKEIKDAADTLAAFREGRFANGAKSDAELWHARQVYESAVHPQTRETVPVAFRLAAFVPVNIPICAGLIFAPPTLANTIFFQWVNQSYNAGFNYANRNASSEQDNSTILKSYLTATFVSCATAVGLGRVVENAKSLSPGTKTLMRKMVPFIAVASAGVFNAVSMRFNELQEGIDIIDDDGEVRGRSVAAGRQSLMQVALTRIALPIPCLLLPPYLSEAVKKVGLMPKAHGPRLATELGTFSLFCLMDEEFDADDHVHLLTFVYLSIGLSVVLLTLCLWGALPGAVALFPQQGTISADDVEEEFRLLHSKYGHPIRQFSYNKGI